MKTKTLAPQKKKKTNYGLKAFLWGAVIASLFIVPSMIMDKGMFLYYGDYNAQVIPFYQIMHEAIRNGEFGWNWYTDLGTSLVGGYGYYNLGSPFFWVMLPFPTEAIPYLMGPLTILKFALSSLTAYIFLKRYTKDKNNAVIGAMLYAFSGFAIYNLVFHFLDVFVFFPLLLATLDSFIFEKKRGRFAVMVAVCAIVNYYFFVAEAVFCLIYWIVRMATKNIKMDIRESLYLIFEAVMGLGMALFMFLPCIYSIIGSSRISNGGLDGWNLWVYENAYTYAKIIVSFFCPPELANANVYVTGYSSEWLSINCFLPLFSMAGVFAIIFNKRRNKWLRVFYGVCAAFMFVPVLNSSFQMFTEAKYLRWFFMLLLIMSLGSVLALEDPSTKWKKALSANLVGVVLIGLIIGFTPDKQTTKYGTTSVNIGLSDSLVKFWIYIAVALINIVLCAFLVRLYKKNRINFKRYACLLTAVAIIITFSSSFIFGKLEGYESIDIVNTNMVNCGDNIQIDDIQSWRSDVITETNYSNIMYDYDTIESIDFATAEKLSDLSYEQIKDGVDGNLLYENDNLTMYWRIPGFECFSSTVNSSVMDFFKGLDFERTTMTDWQTSYYAYRSLFSVKYIFSREGTPLTFVDENGETLMPGWKYYDTQNGYEIYENEYCLPMGFTYDKYIDSAHFKEVPPQFKHLALMEAMVISNLDDMFEAAATGLQQTFERDFDYTLEEFYENYESRMSLTCYDFERDSKGFQAKIDTNDKDEYVFFSVPYDNGWSATVNGEKAEIMRANYGFMAVKVPANQTSTIRFDYHTPGILYGAFVSALCIVLLLIYLAAIKIQSAPPADDEPKTDKPNGGNDDDKGGNANNSSEKSSDESKENTAQQAEDEQELTVFDIVKQTEEETMMHTYSRVPVVLEKGYGSEAYDIEGKKYIDFTSGIGVNCLGYADGRWNEAVEKQLNNVQHTSNLYYNTTQIQLAELLCNKTGYSKVFFANSGAEANECAIKVARKYSSDKYGDNRTHIVTLENSFHGRTITTLSATGQDVFHHHFHPFTEGFSYAKANDMESIKNAVNENTCAVMIELVQGEGGVNPLDKEFVANLSEYCKENDILLIVDEIQTGIGRTGTLFCYENYDIKPDIITSAKALGGGLPLSACLCTKELEGIMTPGSNGTTFGGNMVACAGAMKVLDIVDDAEFLNEVKEKGEYIRSRIKSMAGVKEVRGMGMMIGIVLEKNNAKEVLNKCAENGLLVLTAKTLIRLLPPLNIDYYDLDAGLDILEDTILQTMQDEDSND